MSVRRATLDDLDLLVGLFDGYRQFYGRTSDVAGARTFLRDRLERSESILFLAEDEDGAALGFTQLFPSFTSAGLAPVFILNDLFVVAAARRRGVGKALIDAAAAYARSTGAPVMRLSTARDNAPAQALYEALGWERDEVFFSYNLMLA